MADAACGKKIMIQSYVFGGNLLVIMLLWLNHVFERHTLEIKAISVGCVYQVSFKTLFRVTYIYKSCYIE
jgi:hypothetical protein